MGRKAGKEIPMTETIEQFEKAMKKAAHPDETFWLKWLCVAEYQTAQY